MIMPGNSPRKIRIDPETWIRKEHFRFFSAFDDPFFSVTVSVDFTRIYREAKASGESFFLFSLHHILACVNRTEAFGLRTEGEDLVRYETVHVSPTIAREDGTFGFAFFEYSEDRALFMESARREMERVKNSTGLSFSENTGREDLVRFSSLPWLDFTEMKHAVSFRKGDSVPRISVGRLTGKEGRMMMPVSVCVHHGLMDAGDVAGLIALMEDYGSI